MHDGPVDAPAAIAIRPATPADAEQAIGVVRRSIVALCGPDHQGDPQTLEAWLANKTPASFLLWTADPDNTIRVGTLEGSVAGVGMLHASGELRLFYVAPGAQRRGLGRALHAALAAEARRAQMPALHLCSTSVARPFYAALGYVPCGPRRRWHGMLWCHPYRLPL